MNETYKLYKFVVEKITYDFLLTNIHMCICVYEHLKSLNISATTCHIIDHPHLRIFR